MKFLKSFLIAVITLVGAVSSCFAEAVIFGAWLVDVGDDKSFIYAATENSTGNVFGEYCYFDSGNCIYLLGIKTTCDKGIIVPVLINSDKGASSQSIVCSGYRLKELSLYNFSDFEMIGKVATEANRVGFAFPLKNDEFSVVRFNLNGSDKAISFMREMTKRRMENTGPNSESFSRGKSEERL
jgi:hypothetical protein